MLINYILICVLVIIISVKWSVNVVAKVEVRAEFPRKHEYDWNSHLMPTSVGRHPYTNPWQIDDNESETPHYPVQHAGLPQGLAVVPLPLKDSDHELMFNVTWQPTLGPPARDYSLEVRTLTETVDCQTPMCYDYNIPGNSLWWTIPAFSNPVAETCAVRPGCTYRVRLIAHPWDGHTSANLDVELDECVAGVCSCAHAPRLPQPIVKARTVSIMGDIFVNVSWTLPTPQYPQRLPPGLKKKMYLVSIGKQMVSNAHPAPWFANTISRKVDADGTVFDGDNQRWLLLPITERSGARRDKRPRNLVLDVRLLARVNLVDDWGCIGPAGNITAYDPMESNDKDKNVSVGTYLLWTAFGGACVLTMAALLAVSARVVKKFLNAFRPNAAAAAPLDPLRRRPAWFQMQLRKFTYKPKSCAKRSIGRSRKRWDDDLRKAARRDWMRRAKDQA